MTRTAFLCCFCCPYCPSWVLALNSLCSAKKGSGEIRTFSSLYSDMRVAHNRASWAPFSEGSLATTHYSTSWWTKFGGNWACSTDSLSLPRGAGKVKSESPHCHGRDKFKLCRPSSRNWGNMREGMSTSYLRRYLSSAPPGAVSPHQQLARTCRQMVQSSLPFIFWTLTALCKSQLCP